MDICPILKEEITNITKESIERYNSKDRKTFNLFMDRLKTVLYNYHHMCSGIGDKVADIIPPSPKELAEETEKIAEEIIN